MTILILFGFICPTGDCRRSGCRHSLQAPGRLQSREGDGAVPGAVQGVHEHRPATGAHPLQPADRRGAQYPTEHAEGHEGSGGDVIGLGGRVQQCNGGQSACCVGSQVLPLAKALGQLRQ